MDKIEDIFKKLHIGVCKSNLLQPSQDSDILIQLEMQHFFLLDDIIGPMQRLKKRKSESKCRCIAKDQIDSLTNDLNMSCKMNNDILDATCLCGLILFDNLSKVKLNADSMLFSNILRALFSFSLLDFPTPIDKNPYN